MINTQDAAIKPSTIQCSTGNCTWPKYSTLGVSHAFQDVCDLLQYTCQNHTRLSHPQPGVFARDPCGYNVNETFLTGESGSLGFRSDTSLSTVMVNTMDMDDGNVPFWNSTVFGNATLPILGFYIAYTSRIPAATLKNKEPVLLECLLKCRWSPCVHSARLPLTLRCNQRERQNYRLSLHVWRFPRAGIRHV